MLERKHKILKAHENIQFQAQVASKLKINEVFKPPENVRKGCYVNKPVNCTNKSGEHCQNEGCARIPCLSHLSAICLNCARRTDLNDVTIYSGHKKESIHKKILNSLKKICS
jgi:hypothetical protein